LPDRRHGTAAFPLARAGRTSSLAAVKKIIGGVVLLWCCLGDGLLFAQSNSETVGGSKEKAESLRRWNRPKYRDPLEQRGARAKDVRIKMLVRKKDDQELSSEYEWATRAKAKGLAPKVVYPYALLAAGEGGTATVRFRIGYDGRVELSSVLEASKPEFGRAAQAAIETMTFTPAKKKDGSPALVLCDADFQFTPDGSGDVLVTESAAELLKAMKKDPQAVVALNELDKPLRPSATTTPFFPTALAKAGKPGSASVDFIVNEEGRVVLPRVVAATEEEFGYAAVQAVSGWQFPPPEKHGRKVAARAAITIEFAPQASAPKPAS
jgi:TonB family protein